MINFHLFNISGATTHESFKDINKLKILLNANEKENFDELVSFCSKKIGEFQSLEAIPYRVSNTNYIKTYLRGKKSEMIITIVIVGYTEFQKYNDESPRQYLYVIDSTDAYWLLYLLKMTLSTISVDKAVHKEE